MEKISARPSSILIACGGTIILPARHAINIVLGLALIFSIYQLVASQSQIAFWLITAIALVLGVLIIVPIGGADMPVVISMLNSYSGWAAAGIGFTLGNSALIITGAICFLLVPKTPKSYVILLIAALLMWLLAGEGVQKRFLTIFKEDGT